jgi:hypothetical protein
MTTTSRWRADAILPETPAKNSAVAKSTTASMYASARLFARDAASVCNVACASNAAASSASASLYSGIANGVSGAVELVSGRCASHASNAG